MIKANFRFPKWSQPLFKPGWESAYIYSGRWKGKSWTIADWSLQESYRPGTIMYARDFRSSTKESSYKLLEERIKALGLDADFRVMASPMEIRNLKSGTVIKFVGLDRMADSIRSQPDLRILITEEAQNLKDLDGMNEGITSVRHLGRKFVFMWNPENAEDPIQQMLAARKPTDLNIFLTLDDVPKEFLTDEYYSEYERTARLYDEPMMRHIWDGAFKPYSVTNPFGAPAVRAALVDSLKPFSDTIVAGVDLSYTGSDTSDYTTVIKADDNYQLFLSSEDKRIRSDNSATRKAWIKKRILEEPVPATVLVDVTGGGTDMCESLSNELSPHGITVHGVKFTKPEKVKMVRYAADKFGEGAISLTDLDLHKELLAYNEDLQTGKMAAASGHDDMVAGALLALHGLHLYAGINEFIFI